MFRWFRKKDGKKILSAKDYVTDLIEAIEIMGVKSVITPEQINQFTKFKVSDENIPLAIPRNLLKWEKIIKSEVRKEFNKEEINGIIANNKVSQIYYPPKEATKNEPDRGYKVLKIDEKWDKSQILEKWNAFRKDTDQPVRVVCIVEREVLCPYALYPGVEVTAEQVLSGYDELFCLLNKPQDYDDRKEVAMHRTVEPGWNLIYKNPPRERFANKDRQEQEAELEKGEEWGWLGEAVLAATLFKLIHEENILTDYVHCCDHIYQTEGDWNPLFRNFEANESSDRGNFFISQNVAHHKHRNTVPYVIRRVSKKD